MLLAQKRNMLSLALSHNLLRNQCTFKYLIAMQDAQLIAFEFSFHRDYLLRNSNSCDVYTQFIYLFRNYRKKYSQIKMPVF
jgi:hypothetical protein